MEQLPLSSEFHLKAPHGLCTPAAFMRAILSDEHDYGREYGVDSDASEYAEPGYTNPRAGILFGNWNDKPGETKRRRFGDIAEYAGYALEWYDEWSTCGECNRAVRNSPDSYSWRRSYAILNECELLCHECIKADPSAYVESELLNDCSKADTLDLDLAALGFTKWNEHHYENGWHPGQNDKPADIVKQLPANHDYVFQIPSVGQFDIAFDVWIRPQSGLICKRDILSTRRRWFARFAMANGRMRRQRGRTPHAFTKRSNTTMQRIGALCKPPRHSSCCSGSSHRASMSRDSSSRADWRKRQQRRGANMVGSKRVACCQCADKGCPYHIGYVCSKYERLRTVYRVDMEDRTGTPMCEACADDALSSGLFREDA